VDAECAAHRGAEPGDLAQAEPLDERNGGAERIIRTLKEQLLWVRNFETVEELRLALLQWQQTYNEHWLIERHGHRTPAQVRRDHRPDLQKRAA
jgi:hypothetical protein